MNQSYEILEYFKILEQLKQYANSPRVKEECMALKPYLSESELKRQLRETSEAKSMLEKLGSAPIPSMEGIETFVEKAVRFELLLPEEFEKIGSFLTAVRRMADYLKRGTGFGIGIAYYVENLRENDALEEEIRRCIRGGRIDDYASATLKRIRKELALLEEKIKEKAESLLKSNKSAIAENFVVTRNGRICIPVKKDCKGKIKGSVVDQSATGATLFIEPEAVAKLQNELESLKIEEDTEERRILYTLLDQVVEKEEDFKENLHTLERLDFMFAKAKLSIDMQAVEPEIVMENYICLKQARHPLLPKDSCVPLDFSLGAGGKNGMIITGPNTGGKTVTIKTVGLLTLMAGAGLHVPCKKATIAMRNQVLCDIGDGQNICDNLSTFSAHIKNVVAILEHVTEESLVIMDELGSGTDPLEGMGIALSIIDKLKESGCMFLVTTHYPKVKSYAKEQTEIISARMGFDRENLKPLYRLEMGKSGDSVTVSPDEVIGIVVEPADLNGNVLVQVKKEKILVNQKRLKLKVKAEELYPKDYDFSILFDSVETRKKRHQMERKYVEGMWLEE